MHRYFVLIVNKHRQKAGCNEATADDFFLFARLQRRGEIVTKGLRSLCNNFDRFPINRYIYIYIQCLPIQKNIERDSRENVK